MRRAQQGESLYGFSVGDRVIDPAMTTAVQTIPRMTGTVVKLEGKKIHVLWDRGRKETFASAAHASRIRKIKPGEDW